MHKRLQFFLFFLLIAFLFVPVSAQVKSNDLKVAGLRDRVTVTRDERGIPYIDASNDHDLYFAQGYITASDRLWQLDLLRRNGRGELAELFGGLILEEDKRHRTLGFAKLSEEVAAKLTGETRDLMQAFADGVNSYIAACDERTLPVEFRILKYQPRKWTPADSIIIVFIMSESLSTTWQTDILRARMADTPKDRRDALLVEYSNIDTPVVGTDRVKTNAENNKPRKVASVKVSEEAARFALVDNELRMTSLERIGLAAEGLAASNNWVVSGKRTASGKPLLANDPHLNPSVPNIWYLVHLNAPGMRVAGVSIPGIPGVIIGHNDRIAWGMTNLGPDVQDLYLEKFNPENPRQYLTPSGWNNAEVRREEIKVRKQTASPETGTVNHDVIVTRHGPIVLDKDNQRYALRWTLYDIKPESMSAFYKLNRARNWKEFTDAISNYGGATQNFVYADVDGHIGYYGAGVIPVRKDGDGSVPNDGSKNEGEWTGFIPFDKLPHVFDPPSGMIVTANSRIVGRDYPYFLTHDWSAPYRQKRINDLLAQKKAITVEDFRSVQADVYAIGGSMFAKSVVKLFGSDVADAGLRSSLKTLADWDGFVNPDSRAALLVTEMRDIFARRIIAAAIGEDLAKQYRWANRNVFADRVVADWPKEWLPKEFANWQDFVKACHDDAIASIKKKLGDDESKWTFGNAVQVRLNHPLANAPGVGDQFKIGSFPQRGNGYSGGLGPTPNVGPTVSMRLIADTSNWDNSRHGILLGQSGDPNSMHYKDQLEDWRNVTPRVLPFSKEAVKRAGREIVILIP